MGSKAPIHPNDHCNRAQSSNDTFPTAMHVAVAEQVVHTLVPSLEELVKAFEGKEAAWKDIVKIGRTHLQDATPLMLSQEVSGWRQQVLDGIRAVESTLPASTSSRGGLRWTGLNTRPGYAERSPLSAGKPGCPSSLRRQVQRPRRSRRPRLLPRCAQDHRLRADEDRERVRWLGTDRVRGSASSSFPRRAGLVDHAGRSTPRGARPVHGRCRGDRNDARSAFRAQGNFELNVYKPVMIHNVLESIRLLADGADYSG